MVPVKEVLVSFSWNRMGIISFQVPEHSPELSHRRFDVVDEPVSTGLTEIETCWPERRGPPMSERSELHRRFSKLTGLRFDQDIMNLERMKALKGSEPAESSDVRIH